MDLKDSLTITRIEEHGMKSITKEIKLRHFYWENGNMSNMKVDLTYSSTMGIVEIYFQDQYFGAISKYIFKTGNVQAYFQN